MPIELQCEGNVTSLWIFGRVGGSTDQWVCCAIVRVRARVYGLQGTFLLTSNISFV